MRVFEDGASGRELGSLEARRVGLWGCVSMFVREGGMGTSLDDGSFKQEWNPRRRIPASSNEQGHCETLSQTW